jgi:hypothetical protein
MNKSTFSRFNRWRAVSAVTKMARLSKARYLAVFATIAAIVALCAKQAVATPASGIVAAVVEAQASFVKPTDVTFTVRLPTGDKVTQVLNARETVIQQIVVGPGGATGWHSHPGPVVVLIKTGRMSFYDSDSPTCTPRFYDAGQAFIDAGQGHVHNARNESATDNLELWATYFDVPVGGAFRNDAANPGTCNF